MNTSTPTVPESSKSLLGIDAVNCVLLTKVVVRAAPPHFTTDPLTKLLPFTVNVNEGPPPTAVVGDIDVSTGTGLLIVKVSAFEVPPPSSGLNTVTGTVPTCKTSLAGTDAVNCVALTNVVVSATPFHITVEPLTKPLPFTVNVNVASPAVPNVGDSEVATGTGLLAAMTSITALDVLPPKFASPLYTAVIECDPSVNADVVNVATPETTVPDPSNVAPSKNCTVPVNVPAVLLSTAAMNVTACPLPAGLLSTLRSVVVPGRITVNTSAAICPINCWGSPVECDSSPSVANAYTTWVPCRSGEETVPLKSPHPGVAAIQVPSQVST